MGGRRVILWRGWIVDVEGCGCGGLKLGLGAGVRTMRTGAPASSAPFTVTPNTVAATGKGTFERHSHFRLSDTDDFVCCQVSI